ncbi:beta strand repeat-containing protein, partial [Neisseria weixii]|uniref:beta strand repeat-containing protein n=1 Tax=Neisseria weixii TaxID=1853276 RepID=UPI00360675F5
MNKTYRVVYNETTNTYTAVAEIAAARGKSSKSSVAAAADATAVRGVMKAVGTVLLPAVLMLASGGAYAEATTTGQVGTGIAIGTGTTAGTTATTATWSDSDIAIGKNATAAGGIDDKVPANQIAIGTNANAGDNKGAIAIGGNAKAGGGGLGSTPSIGAVSLGLNSQSKTNSAIAIGNEAAVLSGIGAIAIGGNAQVDEMKPGDTKTRTGSTHASYKNPFTPLSENDDGTTLLSNSDNTKSSLSTASTVIGRNAYSTSSGVAIGDNARVSRVETSGTANRGLGVAIGANAWSQGGGVVIGSSATSEQINAVVIGRQAVAKGSASQVIGVAAASVGDRSVAIGHSATSVGERSIAIGGSASNEKYDADNNARSEGHNSIALGSKARVGNSFVMPTRVNRPTADELKAWNAEISAEADRVGVLTENSIAVGTDAAVSPAAGATAANAIAMGKAAAVSADGGSAIGKEAAALAVNAAALGTSASAAGEGSLAFGYQSSAAGQDGVAVGTSAAATLESDVAVGRLAKANSKNLSGAVGAVAFGSQAMADGYNAVGIGTNAVSEGNSAIAVGGTATGVGAVNVGYQARATKNSAVSVGYYAQAVESNATAVGTQAQATQTGAFAAGAGAIAGGYGAVAAGMQSNAAGERAAALGERASASQNDTLALGSGANAAHDNAVALGSGSVTADPVATGFATINGLKYGTFAGNSAQSTVSIGSSGAERTLTNLAAGRISATSTDGINGSQLYATNAALGNLANSIKNRLGGNARLLQDGNLTMSDIGGKQGSFGSTVHNAILASQEEVLKGTNISSVQTSVGVNGQNIYTVNADGTSVSGTGAVTVTRGSKNTTTNITDYAVDLSAAGKASLAKADSAVQSLTTSVNGTTAETLNSTNSDINFVNGNGTTARTAGGNITFDVNTSALTVNNGQVTAGTQGNAFATAAEVAKAINASEKTTTVAAGRNTRVQAPAVKGNNTEYTVDADKTTVSAAAGGMVKVTAGAKDNTTLVTDYALDLSDNAKADISQGVAAKNKVDSDGLTFTGDSGRTNIEKLGSAVAVNGDKNIATEAAGDKISIKLKDDITVGSITATTVKAGDSTLNSDGLTISGGPGVTKTGIDAGNKPITNLQSGGTTETNAANIADVKNAATVVTSANNSVKVTKTASGLQNTYDLSVATTALDTTKGQVGTPAAPDSYVTAGNLAATINSAVASAKEKVEAGTNIVSVGKAEDAGTGAVTYTVNAKGTTASVAQGDPYLEVAQSDKGGNVTDYRFGLTQAAKDSLGKADSAVQNFNIAVNGGQVQTVSDGGSVKFVNGTGTTAAYGTDGIRYSVNKTGLAADAAGNVTAGTAGDNFATAEDVANVINQAAERTEKTTTVVKGSNTHVRGTVNGNNTEYAVSADKTTVSVSSALVKTESTAADANEAVTTDYALDLSQTTKDDIKKGVDAKETVDNKGLTFTGNSGSTNIEKLGATVAFEGGDNITTEAAGDTVAIKLNKDITLDSVTAGNTVLDQNGIRNGDTALTSDGIKVGGNTLTNAPITVGGNTVANVNEAISKTAEQAFNPLTFAGDSGTEFTRKLGSKINVKGGADEAKLSDG